MSFLEEARGNFSAGFNSSNSFTDDMYKWGRQTFYSSYASGGLTSKVFSPGGRGLSRARFGTSKYNSRLESIRAEAASSGRMKKVEKIDKLLEQSRSGKSTGINKFKGRSVPRMMGGALTVGFVALPAFTTEGGLREKTQAVAGGIAAAAGWELGAKGGMALGATIGSSIVPVVGTAVGAVAGYIAGGFIGSSAGESMLNNTVGYFDKKVERARGSRKFNWRNNNAAFQTQGAYTMRAASLQMMNKGLLSARSGLGHEGVMLHR